MLTRVWLLSLSRAYFVAAISASGFLFLAFLAGWAVTSNAGCIFSAIVTKWTSSPATPYFCRGVCWIFPASVKRNVCTRRGGRDRGGRRQNETWRHLTNPSIWPIRAIRAEKHGLVSFFSVLQLPQRSTTLRIAGPFHPVWQNVFLNNITDPNFNWYKHNQYLNHN